MILVPVAALIAFVLSLLLGVAYIDFLKKKTMSQYILDEAPDRHKEKSGTPTTGGFFIVLSSLIAAVVALFMAEKTSTGAFLLLITFVFYMFAGMQDDIQKIEKHQNKGLSARGKLFLQIAIAILPVLFVTISGRTFITFGDYTLNLGWFYPIFGIFVITGVSNAVNLTDGLDGLAASNMVISLMALVFINLIMGNLDLAIICAAIAGACLGFLYFNKYPAKVFMGDTGSLALGGVLGTIAVMGKFELWLIPIGIIFLCETLSVILQVTSYKLTGKRIFKMSPIHHHFELCGWGEKKIVFVFSLITFIFCAGAVLLFRHLNG
ncbi:TPA: phospho-N-acetylmuramoyl-pentapeptide-transferase [Candidatus Spyradomonas excrementavium]|nr:phospho-N-acetylmuramoyl-pentapeptide-transferase [Candidatus Spyradomonas excrementavium]